MSHANPGYSQSKSAGWVPPTTGLTIDRVGNAPLDTHDSPPAGQRSAAVVQRRFGLSGLLLAAWMTLIPSAGFTQDCLEWADRTPSSTTGPSPRYGHAMAYDSARGVTVLFGGYDSSYNGETWEWDGAMWMPRSAIGPSARSWHAMAYDSARAVTVLFGGSGVGYTGDTWEWDGTTWTLRNTTGPSRRCYHAMTYDIARGVTVLFGGLDDSHKGDTWEWDGTTWMRRSTTGPSPRYDHAMAYDSARGVTVLFGGEGDSYPYYNSDTWEWDGTTWKLRSATGPLHRIAHEMAYDDARGVTMLFGDLDNYNGDTWEWNGTTWALRSTTGPSPRNYHAMAYDSARGVTVLFGGVDGASPIRGDTWEFANCAVVSGLSIAPGGATDFGSIAVGATADRGFTLRNTGSNPIVGSASAPSPFSVVSGASYNLAPGQTQAVTVRYSPTQPGNNIAHVTFTGTGTQQRQLLGSAFATPISGSVVGTVVEEDGTDVATAGQPIPGAVVSIAGGRAISKPDGSFSVTGLLPGTYTLTATAPSGDYLTTTLADLTITAGSTPPVFIKLPRRIVPPPPVPGQRNTPVLLVSGFGCTDPPWDTGSCNGDYCDFTCDKSTWGNVRTALKASGFDFPGKDYVGELVWDPNEPTPGAGYPLAGDILRGTERVIPNAKRLKDYVAAKILQYRVSQGYEPASIDIVASSMGGLITREFLSDRQIPSYDDPTRKLYLRVGKVIMIGTPNAGSLIADWALDFERALRLASPGAQLIGMGILWFACDVPLPQSVKDLETTTARAFQRNHAWSNDIELYLLAGTGGASSECSFLQKGHAKLQRDGVTPEDQVSDGVVPEPSVRGVYSESSLFTGITTTYGYRLPYKGVPKNLPIDHLWLKQDTAGVAWIQCVLTNPHPESACGGGMPSYGAPTVAASAPATGTIDNKVFVLAPGEGTQWVIPIDSATTLSLLLSAGDAMTIATVRDPDGNVVAPTEVNADPWTQTYEIAAPTPGEWTVSFSRDPAATTSAGVSVFAAGDGPVALIPTTEDTILNSQYALVSCALNARGEVPGGGVPVTGATVLVDVALPDGTTTRLVLLDDGLHSDGLADDGTYAAVFTNTAQAGSYRLRYRADGAAGGLAFRRVALGTFGVSSAAARISGNLTDEPVDVDADGVADFLRVQFWVTAQQAGTYLASGLVVDETGGSSIAGSETALELPIGTSTVSVLFDCRKLAVPGTYGPFTLQNLELFERRDDQIAWVDRYREAYTLATAQIEILCLPFDGDCDGDRDLHDFAAFQRCFLPGLPVKTGCERFNRSGRVGVDLLDFAGLKCELAGPMPPTP